MNVMNGKLLPLKQIRLDYRADDTMVKALIKLGMAESPPPDDMNDSTPLSDLRARFFVIEKFAQENLQHLWNDMPIAPNIYHYEAETLGVDGNKVKLYITAPKRTPTQVGVAAAAAAAAATASATASSNEEAQDLHCIYHIHGGGMCYMTAADVMYKRLREQIASLTDMVVIGVEFRNSAGALGPCPFPAGLNDCLSGLKWVNTNKAKLGISKVCVMGESGGGNLSLSVCLLAKQQGLLDYINGVYSLCPAISNVYHLDPQSEEFLALPSLTNNHGITFRATGLALVARLYDPCRENAHNPLAWPYWAGTQDLQGLPPHVISVNELDPLCSEGVAYYRKLNQAGVRTRCRMLVGTTHAADIILMHHYRDLFLSTVEDVKSFIKCL